MKRTEGQNGLNTPDGVTLINLIFVATSNHVNAISVIFLNTHISRFYKYL